MKDVEMGLRSHSVEQVASCAAYLPPEGAVAYELTGGQAWDLDRQIMADVANSLRWLVWAKTKNGQKNRRRPDMIRPQKRKQERAYDTGEIDAILKRSRK